MDDTELQYWYKYQTQLDQNGYDELASRVELITKVAAPAATEIEKTIRICTLNDVLRITGIGGEIYMTTGIQALSENTQNSVLLAIRTFVDFNNDNDPYKKHDCAILQSTNPRSMFKIDYYDKTKTYGSEAPENPSVTSRVMTMMTPGEY